jgi:hypothetical protein
MESLKNTEAVDNSSARPRVKTARIRMLTGRNNQLADRMLKNQHDERQRQNRDQKVDQAVADDRHHVGGPWDVNAFEQSTAVAMTPMAYWVVWVMKLQASSPLSR